MFKFDFSASGPSEQNSTSMDGDGVPHEWYKCERISIDDDQEKLRLANFELKELKCDSFSIKYLSPKQVVELVKANSSDSSVIRAEHNHSDLLPAIYEGGLRIWEGTFDLINWIIKEDIDFKNKKVLDLGCGAGLIGILAHLRSSSISCFQDYNVEVVKWYTIPNALLNGGKNENCKFYSGDWESFIETIKIDSNDKFDYIFTSETIYNKKNHRKVLNVFKELLAEDGVVYLAGKEYYFGVGGSIKEFRDLLEAEGSFGATTCWSCDMGVKRSILKIYFSPNK